MVLYNFKGKPIAYTEDGTHIYLFTGEPVAYFVRDTVYGFNGTQFGWFDEGWIRDLKGRCVFYSENASDTGLVKPLKQNCPIKSLKQNRPLKCNRELEQNRALNNLAWSPLSGTQFFAQ